MFGWTITQLNNREISSNNYFEQIIKLLSAKKHGQGRKIIEYKGKKVCCLTIKSDTFSPYISTLEILADDDWFLFLSTKDSYISSGHVYFKTKKDLQELIGNETIRKNNNRNYYDVPRKVLMSEIRFQSVKELKQRIDENIR